MNCEDYQQQVSKLLDDALEKTKTPEVFNHLGACERCREFFDSTMRIRWAIQSAAPLPMSAAIDADVLRPATAQSQWAHDHGPVQRLSQHRSLFSRISTFALLIMLTLFIGLLFSVNISAQRPQEPIPQELIQPR